MVVPSLRSPGALLDIADALRARLGEGVQLVDDRHRPSISIGMLVVETGTSATTALRDAETAVYRAKEQGRDRSAWFDPSHHRTMIASFELERDLRAAIDEDQLYLEYQPVLDVVTDKVASCEALVRWRHPERGRIGPDEFIPFAEATGLIIALGRWVLRRAVAAARTWPDAVQVAVNLSAPELAEPDLVEFVTGTLREARVPPSRLILEITETAVIHDPIAAARTIASLRAHGISVVIDDFGTGYTSLAFLRDYPLDGLKIDRSFVTDLENGSSAIVDAIIRMSAALDLKVVAEGIETQAELEHLRRLGCRFVQGYLVCRPVASDDLAFTGLAPVLSSPTGS